MPVSTESRTGDLSETLKAINHSLSSQLRVAIPGIIQSFNVDAVTCVVQPAIKSGIADQEGKTTSVSLPLLVDVPVIFPRGGGVTLTFPVKAGDECLVVFADRCIDFWWQSGGVQEPADERQHSLSDAFAIIGPQSQAKKISGISTSTAQLRSDDGAAYIELDPGSHNVTVITPAKLIATANAGTEITSPDIILNGNVTINSNLSQGMGAGGGTATMQGPVTVSNDVIAAGISLKNHVHGGVQSGGSKTGGPQ
ncbi:Gp138 family membrane-puncturing spike protein [Photorhabdus khanii]|uniref:Translation initiation factor IF-2 n=1 Tax=Photorhabdus khanii subsp. guanajuatensis TaxID=2100166 RepID=A0A4R4K4V6_9GAMM|nr:Gp138 family membrane-puncturing spike protein [Photorhabdus khanii]TDB62494.1 translation initiation factor IF-2 [Photorhabdus khanii subsp. guanajuatensis]